MAQRVRAPPASAGDPGPIPGLGDPARLGASMWSRATAAEPAYRSREPLSCGEGEPLLTATREDLCKVTEI